MIIYIIIIIINILTKIRNYIPLHYNVNISQLNLSERNYDKIAQMKHKKAVDKTNTRSLDNWQD